MKLDTVGDLYVYQLQDLYNAERQAGKAFTRIAAACHGDELRRSMDEHAAVTQVHVSRAERMLVGLDQFPGGLVCSTMQCLTAAADDVMQAKGEDAVREAALLALVQKVQHYQIASYKSVRQLALLLGREADVELLDQTLEEEEDAAQQLWGLAEEVVNARAVA